MTAPGPPNEGSQPDSPAAALSNVGATPATNALPTLVPDPTVEQEFQRLKVCYEQNGNSFRSLNQLMWQVPLIAMSLTGGLWYGVANASLPTVARCALLILAGLADFGLGALVLPRVRSVMQAHLDEMDKFYPAGKLTPAPLDLFILKKGGWFGENRGAMRVYSSILLLASLMSLVAAVLVCVGSISPNQQGSTITTVTTPNGTTITTTGSTLSSAALPVDAPAPPIDALSTSADASLPAAVDAAAALINTPVSDASVTLDAWVPPPDTLPSPTRSATPAPPATP